MSVRLAFAATLCLAVVPSVSLAQSPQEAPPKAGAATKEKPKKKGFFEKLNEKIDKLADDKPKQSEANSGAGPAPGLPPSAEPTVQTPTPSPQATPGQSSSRVPINLSGAIKALSPQRCLDIPEGQWDCMESILQASAQGNKAAPTNLAAPEWDVARYLPSPDAAFSDACGRIQGVWRVPGRPRPAQMGPNRSPSTAVGYLEFEKCMIKYYAAFTRTGQVRSFEIQWTPPRFGYLSETETARQDLKYLARDAIELIMLASKGNVGAVERAMREKGFTDQTAESLIGVARLGATGFGGANNVNGISFGEVKYCGFGSGLKNNGLSVSFTCVYDSWIRSFSAFCAKPGACTFTGSDNHGRNENR